MPDIVTLGQKTHYKDECFTAPFEPAPQTILIHPGHVRNSNHWYEWVPLLSGKYRVIRRDARGHGESSAPTRESGYDWNVDTWIAELVDMLDQLGLDKIHLLTESTAGMVGMKFAAVHPERLHSLILFTSPAYLPPATLKNFAMGLGSWGEAIETLGPEAWAHQLAKFPASTGRKDKAYVDWWAKEIGRSSGHGLADYSVVLSKLDGRQFLKDIDVPTLVVSPTNSIATPVEYDFHFRKCLILDLKSGWPVRSRDQNLSLLMDWVMRSM